MSTDTSKVHVSRKEYWVIFLALFVLTVLEVGVAQVPGISKGMVISALTLMALAKAGLVGMFYMHLNHETRVFQVSVLIPLGIPFFYALVLIAEALWRLV